MGSQGAMQSATSSLLGSSPGLDSTGLGNIGLPPTSMNGLSAYQDLYSLGGYGDGRAKAVDALTGSSAAAEFSMQSEDFPALGGASGGSSIRAAGMMPGGVNGGSNPQAPGSLGPASSLDKMTDSFYDRNISTVSQPHSVLGRVQPRSEQVSNPMLIGRGGHIANGYQISEALSASVSQAERSSHAPSALQQRGLHLELSSSPPRGGFPTHMPIQPMNPRSKATSADAEQNTTEDYDILGRGKDSSIRQGHSNSSAKSVANGDTIGARGRLPNGPGVTGAESNTPILSQTANSSDSVAKRASTSADAAPDKYGMKALLPIVLPMSESNGKNENILSVGLDLTALGLNLNSQEPLHKTFENPWEGGQGASGSADNSGSSPKNQDPEYRLPTCYYMQPPALRSSHFNKFQLETLFYIFYNMPHDVLQLLAAVELYNRKWRYHKTLKLWFTCDPEAAGSYETPGYVYFDIKSWERRQFHEANPSFIQGLMTEEELNAVKIPSL